MNAPGLAMLTLLGLALPAAAAPQGAFRKKVTAEDRMARAALSPLLDETGYLSPSEAAAPEEGLRDAPRSAPPHAAASAGMPVAQSLLERLVAERNQPLAEGRGRLGAQAYLDSARNLRFVIDVAQSEPVAGSADTRVARKKLASGLRAELDRLRRWDEQEDTQVSLWITDAEMELEEALTSLQGRKLGSRALRSEVLEPALRAAANLEAAAGRLKD